MRRSVTLIVLVVIAGAAIVGAWLVGYGHGVTAGSSTAAADRSVFPTRAAGAPGAGGAGGFGGQGAGGQGGGGFGGQGSAAAGNATGSRAAGGATGQAGVTGKATKVDSGTITVQGADNTIATVNTTTTTVVRKIGTAALTDLKAGDFIAIQGDKTSDTAYTAKAIFSTGAAGGGAPGGQAAGGQAPSGSASAGQAPGGQGAGGPRGGATSGLPAGFSSGQIGRITKIDGATITMQSLDNTSLTVTTNGSTTVQMLQSGVLTDVKAGDTLVVQGDAAGTNTYTARVIIDQGATP